MRTPVLRPLSEYPCLRLWCSVASSVPSFLATQISISQLLNIWKLVLNTQKNARLGIIGNGDKKFELFLKEKARKLQIDHQLDWLGYVNNEDKYKLYLQSKFLVHSTIYDNNGMVAAEALCSGLPVIMYDLDKLKFYSDGCLKIKIGDQAQYAREILRLIKDDDYFNKIKPSSQTVENLKNLWKWENRAGLFKEFLTNYEKNTA